MERVTPQREVMDLNCEIKFSAGAEL